MKVANSSNKQNKTEEPEKIEKFFQGKQMSSEINNKSLWDIMFHDYMRPMFDYVNANKDNKDCKLHMEQFGELHESQKFDETYQQIDNTWRECADKLKQTKEEDRDRNLYFKNFFWTFRWQIMQKILFKMIFMTIAFTGVYFTGEFFAYLETTDEGLLAEATEMTECTSWYETFLQFVYMRKGYIMLFCIIFIEWPKQIMEDIFNKFFDQLLEKICNAQKLMIYNKYMKVSGATNKTISQGKFHRIFHGSIRSFWGLFHTGAEVIQCVFVLFFCGHNLYSRVGWSFLIIPLFVAAKMWFDKATRRWRERSWRFQHKISDKRSNELNMSLHNVKMVKLYSQADMFVQRIQKWRTMENMLSYAGEFKNWMCHLFHSSLDRSMRPLIITIAMYSGYNISMATIFTTLHMIDWLRGPMHHLPRFMHEIRHVKREFRRIQMFLMVDEVQADMIEETECQKGKPALEMKGNFTWGLVAKQEDEDSEDEEDRVEREIQEKKDENELAKEHEQAKVKVAKDRAAKVKSGILSQKQAQEEAQKDQEKEDEAKKQEEDKKQKEEEEKQKLHTIDSKISLKNIDLSIQEGEFVCIIGETGSGKTSLLNAIFGEMAFISDQQIETLGGMKAEYKGEELFKHHRNIIRSKINQAPIVKRGTTGYVEQNPWIQNMTIRDNILFDQELDENRYVKTVLSCCLERDFKILKTGDLSEIGERGINLSGGQKARVSLARAVYANKDIYLMDDPISALDAQVRKQIFKRVFCGMLQGKTRILATHAIDFVHLADRVVVMKEGEIKCQGTYEEVLENEIVQEILEIHNKHKTENLKKVVENPEEEKVRKYSTDADSNTEDSSSDDEAPKPTDKEEQMTYERIDSIANDEKKIQKKLEKFSRGKSEKDGKLKKDDDDEKDEELDRTILMKAVNTIGGKGFWIIMFLSYCAQSLWHKSLDFQLKSMSSSGNESEEVSFNENVGSIVLSNTGLIAIDMACTFATMYIGARFVKEIFATLLKKVMNAPVNLYFDITPIEKVIGYFNGDIDRCDRHFWGCIEWMSHMVCDIFTKFLIVCWVSPPLGLILVCNLLIVIYYNKYTRDTTDEIARVMRKQHTRMNSHMNQSTEGVMVLRAFNTVQKSSEKTINLINGTKTGEGIRRAAHNYYNKRVDWLSKSMYVLTGLTCLSFRGVYEPIYLAMMYQWLQHISHTVNELMHGFRENERNLKALQRLLKLDSIAQEKDIVEEKGEEIEVPESWPAKGEIEFKDVKMRYRPETDIVLDGLSFKIKPGEKVGIVGRTGAGKSTMSLVLSRICEIEGGSINIDGVDSASVNLSKLREKITVIPQDPVIFKDTIKFNVDPSGTVPDEEIEDLLKRAGLEELLKREPDRMKQQKDRFFMQEIDGDEGTGKGIYYKLNDGGDALSAGEKQLICICRAILRKNKIVVLDEATANIDIVTEQKIYKLINEAFSESTVMTIAHRLNTVLNSDKILVLDAGKRVEFDSPAVLQQNPKSRLSYLLEELKKEEGDKKIEKTEDTGKEEVSVEE